MDDREIVEYAVAALAATFSSTDGPDEALHESVLKATKTLPLDVVDEDVYAIVESALARSGPLRRFSSVTRESIARWFEVSVEQFDKWPRNRLDPEVLIRHLYYERLLASWFEAWQYEVELGKTFDGFGGTEFTPDVHATLETLHGSFQVAGVLFCSDPVETARVTYYLQGLEAFVRKNPKFGKRDIIMMVTPFDFGEEATAFLRNEEAEEDYFVVMLERQELRILEDALSAEERKQILQGYVIDARPDDAEPF